MQKRIKIIIGLASALILGGGIAVMQGKTGFSLNNMKIQSKEDKQLAYLKEHEQEIIDFIKKQNPKIESVQIDWNDVRWGKDPNIFSSEEAVNLYGTFNNIEDSGWSVVIYTKDGKLDMDTMILSNGIRVGGQYFE